MIKLIPLVQFNQQTHALKKIKNENKKEISLAKHAPCKENEREI